MKANVFVNGLLVASMALAGVALGFDGLDIWSDQDETPHAYFDETRRSVTRIDARFLPGGSTTEDRYQLQIEIRAGSSTENYVARVPTAAELPAEVDVNRAGRRGDPVGRAVGTLVLETGDREALTGELFGRELDAEAYQLGR